MPDGRFAPGGILADVGGGSRVGAEEALRRFRADAFDRRVVLDPPRTMIERGRRKRLARGVRPSDYMVGEAVGRPFPDRSIDPGLSIGVLGCRIDESVPRAVRELWRVLRPGGLVFVPVSRWRGDAHDPSLRALGYVRPDSLRPGWSLYPRPATGPWARAVYGSGISVCSFPSGSRTMA